MVLLYTCASEWAQFGLKYLNNDSIKQVIEPRTMLCFWHRKRFTHLSVKVAWNWQWNCCFDIWPDWFGYLLSNHLGHQESVTITILAHHWILKYKKLTIQCQKYCLLSILCRALNSTPLMPISIHYSQQYDRSDIHMSQSIYWLFYHISTWIIYQNTWQDGKHCGHKFRNPGSLLRIHFHFTIWLSFYIPSKFVRFCIYLIKISLKQYFSSNKHVATGLIKVWFKYVISSLSFVSV